MKSSFSECVFHLLNKPDNDVVLVYVSSQLAPVKDPSASHHHTPLAASISAQRGGQAGLRQRGQSQGQTLLAALEAERRLEIPGHRPVLLHKHRDVQESSGAGKRPEAVQAPARPTGVREQGS